MANFEKCPVCDGTGELGLYEIHSNNKCPTCKGARIISSLTGLPPVQVIKQINKIDQEKHQVMDDFLRQSVYRTSPLSKQNLEEEKRWFGRPEDKNKSSTNNDPLRNTK